MILVLSNEDDGHADAVEGELRRLDASVFRFDPARYPAHVELSVRIDPRGGARVGLRDGADEFVFDEVTAAWWRRPQRPRAAAALSGTAAAVEVEAEAADVCADVWELLDVPFVPATPGVLARAAHKLRQLSLAGRLGFEIPDTLVTNDPEAFLDQYAHACGRLVTKRAAVSQRILAADGRVTGRATLAVRPGDLVAVDAVRLAPTMSQFMIDKAFEVRATVVGTEVFAAAIHSQETHHTRVDFRSYDHAHTRITTYALPGHVGERCVALTQSLGLRYSAIDLIVTPDGRVVFLEINPTGQYLWIEHATGLPISRALATLLIAGGES
jgi:glutathione synthase/RimK-type ligase-like ATP-grasp enzyme